MSDVYKLTDETVIARLKAHNVATVYEAMGRSGAMDYRIKPLKAGMRLCAPVRTICCAQTHLDACTVLAGNVNRGEALMIDAGGEADVAAIGIEGVMQLIKAGAAGLIVDGAVRDVDAILASGFAVYVRNTCMRKLDMGAGYAAQMDVKISCGGVLAAPLDIVIGDDDGAAVIPREDMRRVLMLCDTHMEGEAYRLSLMDKGHSMNEIYRCRDKAAKLLENV